MCAPCYLVAWPLKQTSEDLLSIVIVQCTPESSPNLRHRRITMVFDTKRRNIVNLKWLTSYWMKISWNACDLISLFVLSVVKYTWHIALLVLNIVECTWPIFLLIMNIVKCMWFLSPWCLSLWIDCTLENIFLQCSSHDLHEVLFL